MHEWYILSNRYDIKKVLKGNNKLIIREFDVDDFQDKS